MSLKARLDEDMKAALRCGDRARLGVLRMALAAVKQREIDDRKTLDDPDVQGVLEKMVKQRREAIGHFQNGGREDLAAKETAEIDVLTAYLPEPLSESQVGALIEEVIQATGAASLKDMGIVMGEIKARAGARVDMSQTSAKVRARLARS